MEVSRIIAEIDENVLSSEGLARLAALDPENLPEAYTADAH